MASAQPGLLGGGGGRSETEVGAGVAGLCVFPRVLARTRVSMWQHDPGGTMRTSPFVLLFVHPPLRQGEAGLAALSGGVKVLRRDLSQLAGPVSSSGPGLGQWLF